jgi:ADP-heptose:LPS heptosyltransferase
MSRRVLVVRLDAVGDVLLAGPAVRAVAADAEVSMLCGPAGAPAARLLPGVRRVLEWASPWIVDPAPPVTRGDVDGIVAALAGHAFDEAVVLTSFHQSPLPTALLLRLAGVGRITGASVDYPGTLLDVRLRPGAGPRGDLPEDIPEPDRALAIVAAAGFRLPAGDDGRLAVRRPPGVRALLRPLHRRPYVVLHPGASVSARRWPVELHRRAARLLTDAGTPVVVTGGPGERDLTAAVADGHRPGRCLDLGGRTDLAQLSGVLAGASALVAGNTGAAHLAAAVGTPVVSLFAPVVPPERWRPHRVPHVLLGDQDAPCRGSRARECPVPGHPCLSRVAPEEVVAALNRLVAASAPAGPHVLVPAGQPATNWKEGSP